MPLEIFSNHTRICEAYNEMFTSLVHEPRRLFHGNLLLKLSIDKCNFHVHLMDFHVFQGRQCKNITDALPTP
jgi:hypothetical protein